MRRSAKRDGENDKEGGGDIPLLHLRWKPLTSSLPVQLEREWIGLEESDVALDTLGNVGGNSNNVSNGNAGPSYLNANNSLSNSNSNNGARLA